MGELVNRQFEPWKDRGLGIPEHTRCEHRGRASARALCCYFGCGRTRCRHRPPSPADRAGVIEKGRRNVVVLGVGPRISSPLGERYEARRLWLRTRLPAVVAGKHVGNRLRRGLLRGDLLRCGVALVYVEWLAVEVRARELLETQYLAG